MAENKVQFGLKNVYYSVITYSGGVASFGTPKAVPGAVSLTMSPQGDVTPFYADNITYYSSVANNGYSGDLEMARFPDEMLQDIWGMTLGSTSKVISESIAEPAEFALLYQIDGDASDECYVLYRCVGTRPAIGSTTITQTKEPQTQTSTITAMPMANGLISARTTDATPAATKSGWFSAVFVETP